MVTDSESFIPEDARDWQTPTPDQPNHQSRVPSIMDRLKSWAEKILGKEDSRRLNFEVFYSPHGSGKDLEGLEERLAQADVVIPEWLGWTKKRKEWLQQISNGELRPEDTETYKQDPQGFDARLIQLLYNTKKVIVMADVPAGSPLMKAFDKPSVFRAMLLMGENRNFNDVVRRMGQDLRREAELDSKREDYVIKQIPKEIKAANNRNPNLREKKQINILSTFGSAHTRIFHKLAGKYEGASRSYNKLPVIFSFSEEAIRRYQFDKEVDNLLLAKAALEFIVLKHLQRKTKASEVDTGEMMEKIRQALGNLDYQETREAFRKLSTGASLEGVFDIKFAPNRP